MMQTEHEHVNVDTMTELERQELERRKRAEEMRDRLRDKAPDKAQALIVAELHEDDSDIMTDYFAHRIKRRVAIGYRTSKRESFKQLRKAAAQFPETAHLGPNCDDWYVWIYLNDQGAGHIWRPDGHSGHFATEQELLDAFESARQAAFAKRDADMAQHGCHACADVEAPHGYRIRRQSVEHRENYSMGGGNYLKRGGRHSSGWSVNSVPLDMLVLDIEDAIPEKCQRSQTGGQAEPVDRITVTGNHERNGVEIRFPSKPADDVRGALKARGFRWHRKARCWYARRTTERLQFAHSLAEHETSAE